ncbi:GrpB family protein [Halobacillus salinus]|uniref:GrpB family protein n=1 Tax=Halobacillus salinus TaxID=192814 RepID=UPI0009A55CF4|nr:GrpB family protein [Halobacillus salinus]
MRQVQVHPYQKRWRGAFLEERRVLFDLFGENIVDVHHIGSTAVEGMAAKPVIDMIPVVKHLGSVDDWNPLMKQIGYVPKGENGIKGRRFFQKGEEDRTHHLHFYQQGSEEIERHLAFRDYLRNHEGARDRYSRLKGNLSAKYPYDIEAYINGKSSLVREIEQLALKWRGLL